MWMVKQSIEEFGDFRAERAARQNFAAALKLTLEEVQDDDESLKRLKRHHVGLRGEGPLAETLTTIARESETAGSKATGFTKRWGLAKLQSEQRDRVYDLAEIVRNENPFNELLPAQYAYRLGEVRIAVLADRQARSAAGQTVDANGTPAEQALDQLVLQISQDLEARHQTDQQHASALRHARWGIVATVVGTAVAIIVTLLIT